MHTGISTVDDKSLKISLTNIKPDEEKEIKDFRKENKSTDDFLRKFFKLDGDVFFLVDPEFRQDPDMPTISSIPLNKETTPEQYRDVEVWSFKYYKFTDPIEELLKSEYVIFNKVK